MARFVVILSIELVLFVPEEEFESERAIEDIAVVDIDLFCWVSCPELGAWFTDDNRAACKAVEPHMSLGISRFRVTGPPPLVAGLGVLSSTGDGAISINCFGGTLCALDCICKEDDEADEFRVIIFFDRTVNVAVAGVCSSSGGGCLRVGGLGWLYCIRPLPNPEIIESSSISSSSDVCPEGGERNPDEGVIALC